jgi:hypothetical protein
MTRVAAIPNLDPAIYQRHVLHADDRVWVEKNCYVDIWIEVVHALGCEPMAMMPFALGIDFEGDQWTFFKPSHDEIYELYGIDVQELNVWLSLLEHAQNYLADGKLVCSEADAFWLPDTAGTDYQRQHTKSSIIISDLDVERQRLGYFHNAGYYALEGEEFVRTFRVGSAPDPAFMPLYAEAIRFDQRVVRDRAEISAMSRALLVKHLARRPRDNPVKRFADRFAADLGWIEERGLDFYHRWAFATVRQLGAAFEAEALYLRWLAESCPADAAAFEQAAGAFSQISDGAKVFILKAARAVNRKRGLDATDDLGALAGAWQRGMDVLCERLGV